MVQYFGVKNLETFQHYKDRNPPWIKLYSYLLEKYEFARLQDASKLHLIMIWLLASRTGNKLPHDPEWISKRINATSKVDLKPLFDADFLFKYNDDSNMLADCLHDAIPETERETEGETEKESSSLRSDSPPAPKKAGGGGGKHEYPPEFERDIWAAYGQNGASKFEALKSYQRAIKNGGDHDVIAAGIVAYRDYLGRNPGTPIAHLTTFLNQKRWETDYLNLNDRATGRKSAHETMRDAWGDLARGDTGTEL